MPTFNYFQTALVLAADGWLDPRTWSRVARALIERAGYTPRRLENSLADLVRRGLRRRAHAAPADGAAAARRACCRRAARRAGWRALRAALAGAARAAPRRPAAGAGALDYDAILDRLRPARDAARQEAQRR